MQLHEFIFSNKISQRLTRHLVFWSVYFFFFWLQSFSLSKFDEFFISETYYFAFLNLCCFGPVFILATYFFIYYLLPQTLQKGRYALFILLFLLVYLAGTIINYFTADIFLNAAGRFLHNLENSIPIEPDFQQRMEISHYNTRWGMIIASVALGIKISKNWYLQQKENLAILKQKTRAEMQLQKARIHPELLFRSLESIHSTIQSGSVISNTMILSLSDLLSYSLYESGVEFVPLEKELMAVGHIVGLEQLSKERSIEIGMQTEGELGNKFIAPMILVKLIEESLKLLHNDSRYSWLMNVHITNTETGIELHLVFTKKNNKSSSNPEWRLLVVNASNRLNEYYPSTDYRINLAESQRETSIKLNLTLAH